MTPAHQVFNKTIIYIIPVVLGQAENRYHARDTKISVHTGVDFIGRLRITIPPPPEFLVSFKCMDLKNSLIYNPVSNSIS